MTCTSTIALVVISLSLQSIRHHRCCCTDNLAVSSEFQHVSQAVTPPPATVTVALSTWTLHQLVFSCALRQKPKHCLHCRMLKFPGMRPTAEIVAVLNKTPRRTQLVGILKAEGSGDVLRFIPSDPRMPHMMVNAATLPASIQPSLQVRHCLHTVPL